MEPAPQTENYYEAIGVWSKAPFGTARMYAIGFILSLFLTLGSYILVIYHVFSSPVLMGCIIALAVFQLIAQLVFFLHFGGGEKASKLRLLILVISVSYTLIIVGGSMWIMLNLNQRMMPTTRQMESYMRSQSM